MTRKEALDKIKKCLSLSESQNVHEAESALLRAQTLMIKYNISEDKVKKYEGKKNLEKFVKSVNVIYGKKRIMWYETMLAGIVGENFRVVYYQSGNRDTGRRLVFMGLSEDIEVAIEVFDFAKQAMIKFSDEYLNTNTNIPKSNRSNIRNDFYRGFISGIDYAFKKQVEENNWGLILKLDELVVKEMNNLNLTQKKKTGILPKFANSTKAYNEGYEKGVLMGEAYKEDILPDSKDEENI